MGTHSDGAISMLGARRAAYLSVYAALPGPLVARANPHGAWIVSSMARRRATASRKSGMLAAVRKMRHRASPPWRGERCATAAFPSLGRLTRTTISCSNRRGSTAFAGERVRP